MEKEKIKELEKLYRKERDGRIKIRILSLILKLKGFSYNQISDILLTPKSTIADWIKRWEKEGRFKDNPRSGAPRKLSPEKIEKLRADLNKNPKDFGYIQSAWTTELLRFHIKSKYGKEYNGRYLIRFLRKLGFELIKPRQKLYKRSEDEVKEYRKKLSEEVKKAKEEGKEIAFVDESIFQVTPRIRWAWFPKGSKPCLKINWNPKIKVVVYGALKETGEFVWKIYEKLNCENTKDFLSKLGDCLFILDNAKWHNVSFRKLKLPRYSPEENPVEQVWRKAKMLFSNFLIRDSSELIRYIEAIMKDINVRIDFSNFGIRFFE